MDSAADVEAKALLAARSDNLEGPVAEKRPAAEGSSDDGSPAKKKKKVESPLGGGGGGGGCSSTVECMRRVAEIVLVLSALGKIRGGRSPTVAEMEMMAEAKAKVAELCAELAPKDVIPRDAVGVVMEDLGLNRVRDQRLGFRPPKLSIADKMLLTKRKVRFRIPLFRFYCLAVLLVKCSILMYVSIPNAQK